MPPAPERDLLDAVGGLGGDLVVDDVLERLLTAARRLTGARRAAIGLRGPDGMLAEFVTQDQDGRTVRQPTPPPPEHATLDLPVRAGGTTLGQLSLARSPEDGPFGDADVTAATALAQAGGTAVANARRFEQGARRQAWLEALAEIQEVLLASTDRSAALRLIATRAREVAGADFAAILLLAQDDELVVEVLSGADVADAPDVRFPLAGSLTGEVLRSGRAAVVDDLADEEPALSAADGNPDRWSTLGAALFVPLTSSTGTLGVLVVAARRERDARFSLTEVQLVGSLAGQAALALERLRARDDRARLAVFEDRDRIARDLHDLVIQRLFATGLQLQTGARGVDDPALRARLDRAVDDLDATIASIRTTIFQLGQRAGSLASEIRGLVDEIAQTAGVRPVLTMHGPVDEGVPERVRPHVLAVLREGLTNIARHAEATRAAVDLEVGDDIVVVVEDDGVGIRAGGRRSGLRNLRERAESLGGELLIASRDDDGTGTRLTWRVPQRA